MTLPPHQPVTASYHQRMSSFLRAKVIDPMRRRLGPVRRELRRRTRPWLLKEAYINACLRGREDSIYLEIGVRDGDSFRAVHSSRKLGIDPMRTERMHALRMNEEFYEMTSDTFLAERASGVLTERTVSVALVDGLHEFCQALTDVLNLEPYMRSDGLIIIDDCNPPTRERGSQPPCSGSWNGDVWKVAAYLRGERPDLSFQTIDADEGIGLVSGFNGPAPALTDGSPELYASLDYSYLEENRARLLGLVPPGPAALDSLG